MENKNHIVVGMGEIGQAVYQVIGPCLSYDMQYGKMTDPPIVPILHIAIPYTDKFVQEVIKYKELFKSELVIIYSTVAIGVTEMLGESFVHSPIEGRHPYLKRSIQLSPRWLGSGDKVALKKAANLWANYVEEVKPIPNSNYTEFLKLRSTSRYGINIAFARYEKEVADQLGMKWEYLKEFDRDYNELYLKLNLPDYQRYILEPPEGPIGGHCVVPNAKLLDKDYPNKMLKEIK